MGNTINPSQIAVEGYLAKTSLGSMSGIAGEDMQPGSIVYLSGMQQQMPIARLASAISAVTCQTSLWVVTERALTGDQIALRPRGAVQFDTSAFSAQALLYLSAITPGEYTAVAPIAPSPSIVVGEIITVGVQGYGLLKPRQ